MHFTQNSSNKQTQSTHRKARLEPAIRDAQKLAQNVFPHRNSTVTSSKKQENEKPEMCLMFFSMQRHYTTTFRYVAVILVFFQRGLSIWFLDNLYLLFFIFVFLFLLKTGRKIMMTMFWSGEKARKKSLFIILGYFNQGFRLDQATVLMKSKVMATSLTNSSMQSFWGRRRWMK